MVENPVFKNELDKNFLKSRTSKTTGVQPKLKVTAKRTRIEKEMDSKSEENLEIQVK
jgi:hypothetical protein